MTPPTLKKITNRKVRRALKHSDWTSPITGRKLARSYYGDNAAYSSFRRIRHEDL